VTLAIVSIASFMVAMEITIISLAFPEIQAAFPEASRQTLSWVFTTYNIGVAALLLIAGWLADKVGRKRIFLIGIATFTVGSLLCAAAQNAGWLIGARALQSVGGALQFPAGLALLLPAFPPERRQSALGIWGMSGGLAAAFGPTIGALLVGALGWRAVFGINVPLGALGVLIGGRWLVETKAADLPRSVDLISVPLASLSVAALVLAIVQGDTWGWGSGGVVGSLAVAVALFALFLSRSRQHPSPLFDLNLLRIRSYAAANLGSLCFATAFFGWLALLPTYVQEVWGYSVLKAGFAIAPGPLLAGLLSPVAGRLADRIGHRPLLVWGGLCGATGLVVQALAASTTPRFVLMLLIPGLLIGICSACGFSMFVGAAMRDVPPARFGMGGAGRTTIFQLAVALGIAVAVAVVGQPAGPDAALRAFRISWLVSAALFAAQAVLMLVAYPVAAPARRDALSAQPA
jgi:EmrB/QacA subfamily drug resistance transporter